MTDNDDFPDRTEVEPKEWTVSATFRVDPMDPELWDLMTKGLDLTITVHRALSEDTLLVQGRDTGVVRVETEEETVAEEIDRQRLVARARELGVYDAPEERTDKELADAIAAEEASGEWLDRLEALPTDEEKRAAVHRLAEEFRRQS